MELSEIGLPTYHTRVERWECDYNDHWNVRFYGRSFQMASEVTAMHSGETNPGAEVIHARHIRFHRELLVFAPVEIRSALLKQAGELDGAVVHLLMSAGKLAATALDFPGGADHLPCVTLEDVPLVMPRGIIVPAETQAPERGTAVTEVELGPIRSEDLDHTRQLRFETLLRHGSVIQHTQFNKLGLTPEYSGSSRINRMGVEFRITRGVTPPIGALLRGQTWVTDIKHKTIRTTNRISSANAELVGVIEMCIVTVDLDTRKAVPVPEFMHEALAK